MPHPDIQKPIFMDSFKRTMTFSRSERIAIIAIVTAIVIILITKYFIIKNPPQKTYFVHNLDSIVERHNAVKDSIRVADSIAKEEAETKKALRRANYDRNKHINKPKRNTKTVIDKHDTSHFSFHPDSVEIKIVDINSADTIMLQQLPGIGAAYARWIADYRDRLGGYCETEQLLEVYRMDSVRYNGIKDYIKIDSAFIPNKLRINYETFKTLLKHPYLEYDNVKRIVNYREQKGLITSWEQLMKVDDAINPKMRYYIEYQ